MTLKQIEAAAVNAATPDNPQADQLAKYCESLTIEETQYFLTIFNLIRSMRDGSISKTECTRIKELSRSRMQRYQNWQSSVRKFYTEQIRNVEKQREERNELVKRLNERDAPGTLKTALQLVDHLTGENIYFKMSLAMRSGIEDREFDAIVEECAQFLISPLTVKEQIREIVNLLNEM